MTVKASILVFLVCWGWMTMVASTPSSTSSSTSSTSSSTSSSIILTSSTTTISFDASTYSILSLSRLNSPSVIQPSSTSSTSPWWSITFVIDSVAAPVTIDSTVTDLAKIIGEITRRSPSGVPLGLTITYLSIQLTRGAATVTASGSAGGSATSTVTVAVDITFNEDNDDEIQLYIRLQNMNSKIGVGAWSWTIRLADIALTPSHHLVENVGLGVDHACYRDGHSNVQCSSFSNTYPQATYQFITSYCEETSLMSDTGAGLGATGPCVGHSSVYVATHDSTGSVKTFDATVNASVNSTVSFSITTLFPNAGSALPCSPEWLQIDYPVTWQVYDGDWWDASQIYRTWVLPSSLWTRQGPLLTRTDIPSWVYNTTIWVNSHWQQNDIFNITDGDPQVVYERVKGIVGRLGLGNDFPIGLHYYEWDTLGYKEGSNYTDCVSGTPLCGFDTHYPDYFPPRHNFASAVQALQSLGVKVAPYINGRIYDQGVYRWAMDGANSYAAKGLPGAMFSPPVSKLETYTESYGSKAVFAPMCSFTEYWQDIIANTTNTLTGMYGTDGVYIDQIGAAGAAICHDPSHHHPVGGGHHWVDGYRNMMMKIKSYNLTNPSLYLTESNSEPFMDTINMYLTLVGYNTPIAGTTSMRNVFHAVYGGYVFTMGAMFNVNDFKPSPDVFASKLAQQFIYGSQLGWFSLGGLDHDGPGPSMRLYESLMDSQYDEEIRYLQGLAKCKRVVNWWLQTGQALRDIPVMVHNSSGMISNVRSMILPSSVIHHPSSFTSSSSIIHNHSHGTTTSTTTTSTVSFNMNPIAISGHLAPDASSILIVLTSVQRAPAGDLTVSFTINVAKYGFTTDDARTMFQIVEVSVATPPTERVIGTYVGSAVTWSGKVLSRQVVVLRVEKVKGR